MTSIHPVSECINKIEKRILKHKKLREIDEVTLTTAMKHKKGISQNKIFCLDATTFVQEALRFERNNWYEIDLSLDNLAEMIENLSIGVQLKKLAEECDLNQGYLVVITVRESALPVNYHWRVGSRCHGQFQTVLFVPFSKQSKVLPRKMEIIDERGASDLLNYERWDAGLEVQQLPSLDFVSTAVA
jgi:hypothetical protein